MDPAHSIDTITPASLQAALEGYPSIVAGRDKIRRLDQERYESIPAALAARDDAFLTKSEVTTLVDWKLSHGTFRPSLQKLVAQNGEDDITSTTRQSFADYAADPQGNIKSSLTTLTKLRGIGPATASLLLSVAYPSKAPFFSDELFRWAFWEDKKAGGWDRQIKYTPKEYLELFEKIRQVQTRLENVKAVDLERVAYVLGKRAAGRTSKSEDSKDDEASLKPKDTGLKRKAKDGEGVEDSKTKRPKKSKAEDKEPAKGTRASARVRRQNEH